jgi:RHS repeat-associated protein
MPLPLATPRRFPGLPRLALPGVRWTSRFARWVGTFTASCPCHALIGCDRRPALALVVADDLAFGGLAVVLEQFHAENGLATEWRLGLRLGEVGSVAQRLDEARSHLALAPGAQVHVQRGRFTVRRIAGGVRSADLDGLTCVVREDDPLAIELYSPYGERARARFDAHGALQMLEVGALILRASHDDDGRLRAVESASGDAWAAFVRDERQLIRQMVRGGIDVCGVDYDTLGRVSQCRSPERELRLHYADDKSARTGRFTDTKLGAWTIASGNELGWAAIAADRAWSCAFDRFGALVREICPDAEVVEIERDETNGGATLARDADGETSFFYDADGFVVYADGPGGAHSELEYDRDGRLTRASVPGVGSFRRAFDSDGRILSAAGPGRAYEIHWAEDGRSVVLDGPRGTLNLALHEGRVHRVADASRSWSLAQQDCANLWLTGSEGQQIYFATDTHGRQRWGASGVHDAILERDGERRVIAYDGAGAGARATRDARGGLLSISGDCAVVRDPSGEISSITVGSFIEEHVRSGTALSVHRSGGIVSTRACEGRARVRAFSPGLGSLELGYDAHARLVRAGEPAPDPKWTMAGADPPARAPARSFEYDSAGRVHRASFGERALSLARVDGAIVHEHDGAGEVRSARDTRGFRTALRTSMGLSSSMLRDASGRIVQLQSELGELTRELHFDYDAAGREIERRVGALSIRLSRDVLGRVVRRTILWDGRTRETTDYGWMGPRLRTITSSSARSGAAFEYDARGALAAWTNSSATRRELLAGGIFGHILQGVVYDSCGRPTAAGELRYEHAPGGHLWRSVGDSASTRFAFDALGQLSTIRSETLEAELERDAFGRLLARRLRRYRLGGETARLPELASESRLEMLWDGPRVVHRRSSGAPEVVYAWADGLLVVTFVGAHAFAVVPGPMGDADALVNEDGEVVWTRDPMTLVFGAVDEGARDYGLPGLPDHHFDAETGLWYSLFRVFDPATGRYLSPSPLGLASGPWLYAGPLDPICERMRFGIGVPREPFWSELGADTAEARWTSFVLAQLVHPADERGRRSWSALSDRAAPDAGAWLLELAGLREED